jgi:hypothetical protein
MPVDRRLRSSFTPEALRKYARLFEEVWAEVVKAGLVHGCEDSLNDRTRLAKSVFRLAQTPWTEIQMRQLLLRGLHNETARRQRAQ